MVQFNYTLPNGDMTATVAEQYTENLTPHRRLDIIVYLQGIAQFESYIYYENTLLSSYIKKGSSSSTCRHTIQNDNSIPVYDNWGDSVTLTHKILMGDTFSMDYATWYTNTFTINFTKNTLTFDGNMSDRVVSNIPPIHTDFFAVARYIPDIIPVAEGFKFVGWKWGSEVTYGDDVWDELGGKGLLQPGHEVQLYNDATLYAQWKPLNIIHYNHNGEWVLCYEFYKVNGVWYPCIRKRNFNGKYTYEIAILFDEEDNILTDENGNVFVIID